MPAQNPQTFLMNGVCDPRTRFFSVMPQARQTIAGELPHYVTKNKSIPAEIYVGWGENPVEGPCVADDCGGGMEPPELAKCTVSRALPFGEVKICSWRVNPYKIDDSDASCRAAQIRFMSAIGGIGSGDAGEGMINAMRQLAVDLNIPDFFLLRPNLDGSAFNPVSNPFAFGLQYSLAVATEWMAKTVSCWLETGTAPVGVPANACKVMPNGLDKLLECNSGLYDCVTTGGGRPLTAAEKRFTKPMEFSTGASPLCVDSNTAEQFYVWINNLMACVVQNYEFFGRAFRPKLRVPSGYASELIKYYNLGRIKYGNGAVVNTGPEIASIIESSVAANSIRTLTRFGNVTIEESDCLTATDHPTIAGKKIFNVQIVPERGVFNGVDPLRVVYYGYTPNGDRNMVSGVSSDATVYDVSGLLESEKAQAGRFLVTREQDRQCVRYCIETRFRVENQLPALTGLIKTLCFDAQSCVGPVV